MKKHKVTDKNIFETASRQLSEEKTPKDQHPAEPAKAPAPAPPPRLPPPARSPTYRDPELNDMMNQINTMKEDLQKQMETISKKSGLSYDDLKKIIENPKRFQPIDREGLKQKQQDFSQKITGTIGSPFATAPKPRQRENVAGERKAKTLGARKKWIPMK